MREAGHARKSIENRIKQTVFMRLFIERIRASVALRAQLSRSDPKCDAADPGDRLTRGPRPTCAAAQVTRSRTVRVIVLSPIFHVTLIL
jgi:hypothetical protein